VTAHRSANQQKIGDYFAACMDETTVERLGAAPLAPTLARIAATVELMSNYGRAGYSRAMRSHADDRSPDVRGR